MISTGPAWMAPVPGRWGGTLWRQSLMNGLLECGGCLWYSRICAGWLVGLGRVLHAGEACLVAWDAGGERTRTRAGSGC